MAKKKPAPADSPKFDPIPLFADSVELVRYWTDEVAKVDLEPVDRDFLNHSRHWLLQAAATLDALDLSGETRQAIDVAMHQAFNIGEIKGRMATAVWARKAYPRLATHKATKERVKGHAPDIEARQKEIREIICSAPNKRPGVKRLARKFGVSESTIKRDLEEIRTTTSL
jgi:hypothetical protein